MTRSLTDSQLAEKMLKWQELRATLDDLEMEIQCEVLDIGKTYDVGNVRATYSKGRTERDYEKTVRMAGLGEDNDIVQKYTTPVVDWNSVCKELGFEGLIKSQGKPSVTVKIKP